LLGYTYIACPILLYVTLSWFPSGCGTELSLLCKLFLYSPVYWLFTFVLYFLKEYLWVRSCVRARVAACLSKRSYKRLKFWRLQKCNAFILVKDVKKADSRQYFTVSTCVDFLHGLDVMRTFSFLMMCSSVCLRVCALALLLFKQRQKA